MRDADGNLKVVYHGTRNADFTVFRRNVNFFTDSREMAGSYAPTGEMYEGYVNIIKPYEVDAGGEKWSKIPVDGATKDFLQSYGASVFKEDGKWRTTPADLAAAVEETVDSGELDYDGVAGFEAIKKEVVADLVGDYLFTDEAFVKHLSAQNRGLFEKIYDEIKYLCKAATAGSKEARKLEKVKKVFEEVYRGDVKAVDGTKHSISNTQNMEWADQINGALHRGGQIKRNDTLVVGDVADFLVADGVSQKHLAIPLSVITKAQNGGDASHSISNKNLRKLDKGIRNAPLIIDNPKRNSLVYVTDVMQGGKPVLVSFSKDSLFDGDDVHKATSIHLQMDTDAMLKALPAEATIYVRNENGLSTAVGVTNNLRSLAASVKSIADTVPQQKQKVNGKFSLGYHAGDSNQIKSTENENPTADKDIRYSLSDTTYAEAVNRGDTETAQDGSVQLSVSEIIGQSGKSYGIGVKLDSNLLTDLTETERKQMVKLRVVEELAGHSFTAYDENNNPVTISIAPENSIFRNEAGKRRQVVRELYRKHIDNETKQEAVVLADELIENSKYETTEPAKHQHGWLDNNGQNGWDKRTVYLQDKNNTVWEATLHIANSVDGEKFLYDVAPIEKVEGAEMANSSTTDIITQEGQNVNDIRYSFSNANEAPTQSGSYHISGEDVKLQNLPIREDLQKTNPLEDDIPIRKDLQSPTTAEADGTALTESNSQYQKIVLNRKSDLYRAVKESGRFPASVIREYIIQNFFLL